MSISSLAEDSALRLTASAPIAPDAVIARAAARSAAAAAKSGVDEAEATLTGELAGKAARNQANATSKPQSPLAQLVKYVPTESIAMYVAVQAALGDIVAPKGKGKTLSDADFTSRWIWLWIILGLTLLLTAGLSYRSQKTSNSMVRFKLPVFEVLAAGAAFLIWGLSLPGTPLRDLDGYDYSAWSSVIILGGTVVIATTAHVLGKSVSWTKVLDS